MSVKQRLLDAGVHLLNERGVGALTQPKVAAQAGVKQSHLTYYFPTRNQLLLGIAEHAISTMLAQMQARMQALPKDSTLTDQVKQVVLHGLPPKVIIGLIAATEEDPDIRLALDRLVLHIRQVIPRLLAMAGLPSDPATALLFHAAIVGLAVMHQARQNAGSADDIHLGVQTLVRYLTAPTGEPT